MFTCITIKSNNLDKHPLSVTSSTGSLKLNKYNFVTKVLLKFCINKLSQYFLSPVLAPIVNHYFPFYDLCLVVLEPLGICSKL